MAVRKVKGKGQGKGIVVGVGGGKKGGLVICEVELGRDITGTSASVR